MKKTSFLKKLTAMAATLAMTCVMAVGAFAAEPAVDYKLDSAAINVGETWTMSVPAGGMYDWNLSNEYIAYGPSMADKAGVLKQVGYETANGVSTITYEAMMPGTCTVTLTDRSFAKIAEATVTVTDGSAAPDTPSVDTPSTDNKAAETPAAAGAPSAAAAVSTAPVDTRTAPQSDTTEEKTESLREFRFTTGLGGANGDFLYDEDGRLSHITLGIYDDFSQDYDINFDYTDGKASASFDAAQAAAMEGSPYVLEVTDLTLKDDGTPDALSACTDCAVYIEFNEDGLPSFFAVAQEDVGYQITYTRTDDGRFVMDSAQCVYGYIYNHSAEPTNDFFTPTGEILYQ